MERFILYNNDDAVASFVFSGGMITDYCPAVPERLPMQIRSATSDGFTMWLRERSIDMNTLLHRQLMYQLFSTRDRTAIALKTRMFSLSDTFTCFPEGEFVPRRILCRADGQECIADHILVSSDTSLKNACLRTPNASTDGCFVKTWKYVDGAWWLYKIEDEEACLTECAISEALRGLCWDGAVYKVNDEKPGIVRSRCFVGSDEFFEPYDSFRYAFSDRSDDEDTIRCNIASLGEEFARAWRRICLADALFMNTDRHMRNFGVIRSSQTGDILRLAPNFDNNQAYKAVKGVHYSGAFLREYMKKATEEDKKDLDLLAAVCAQIGYLSEAAECAGSVLQKEE